MSLITASNLSKSYEPVDIFAGVTFSLPHRARYAIVGPNGVGKTTLLRILAGREKPSGGALHIARDASIGYLPQEAAFGAEHTLWEECLQAFGNIRAQEKELKNLETELAGPNLSEQALEALMERYGELQARFEHQGGYSYETRIRQVLTGLGFAEKDYSYPLNQLSGGQRTRALLARLLLSDHDLLLLDEPTNHLDIQAVEWLEGYLRDWEGAALIVSHDRYFLDRVATHILEMFRGSMETFRGNYSGYLEQRELRWDQRMEFFEREKARLENELDYIKRNIAGQNVSQAKGKLRRLSRYLEAVEQLGFEGVRGRKWMDIASEANYGNPMGVAEAEERIKALRPPISRHQKLHINLKPRRRSGNIILRTSNLKIGYPGNPLFETPDIELKRLECAAVIGPNGAGKSTFLKTILEQQPPLDGSVSLGASLDVAYFAQAHEDLNPGFTLMQEIDAMRPSMLPGEVRDYLAKFLFTGEDVFKPVSVLSGGERGRLALAKLALTDANLLLLDEPTNHLDIPAQEILEKVLSSFEGTILLVSHDRYLINVLATQIWTILPDEAGLDVFKGRYDAYREAKEAREGDPLAKDGVEKVDFQQEKREKNRLLAESRKRSQRLEELESLISILEEQLAAIGQDLEKPPDDPGRVQLLGREYLEKESRLNELIAEWEALHLAAG
jgi:ATP-binding cassette subfamily F protein 3